MWRARLAVAVTALRAGALLRAWRAWFDFALESAHKKQLMRLAIGRFVNRQLHVAFSAWQVGCGSCALYWSMGASAGTRL